MKRLIILIILIIVVAGLHGFFKDFTENPADIADRTSGDIILPGFFVNGGLSNNHISVEDMSMFDKEHILTQSEKDQLSSSNLNFAGYTDVNLLSFGYRNWEFTAVSHIRGYLGDIDKEFMEVLFNGNDQEYYNTTAMNDTYLYHFVKLSFNWAYPNNVNLSVIPQVVITDKDSGAFMVTFENILNYIRETDIYLGARINIDVAAGYAEVVNSEQEFTSCEDSLYVESHVRAVYTDPDAGSIESNFSSGLGLGFKMKLPDGWLYFSIDDLATKLTYSGLVYSDYYNYHLDYLDFMDEDHEAIDESENIDGEDYGKDEVVKLDPSISLGVEYYVGKGFDVMAKYQKCDYVLDGLFLGTTYHPVNWLPLKFTYGSGDIDSYNFKFGMESESFEMLMGGTYYDGLFNSAKGFGVDFGIKFKF